MKKLVTFLLGYVCFVGIIVAQKTKQTPQTATETIDGHPSWIMQGNIYEVNVRQYTQEGTFNAFSKHLDRLKNMGVQTLWFMPIHPIGVVDRKGTLGSYYAVSDYTAINPEFGDMKDWKALVKTAHTKGFKVIIDWVPNHTSCDHGWLTRHPDFYVQDIDGKPAMAFDWSDTKQLNYKNEELVDSMIASMKFWIEQSDIDGFRCDVAGEVPDDFWKKAIPELKKMKNVFMLAEGDKPSLNQSGFDASYPWAMFAMMKKVAKGERMANSLDSIRKYDDTAFPKNTIRMYFTSNHDENSWNKADFETMPGAIHAPFAVFTQTMVRSVPLIYSGQEEPVLRPIEFFEKDPMNFAKYKRADFYKTLLNLRMRNEALSPDAAFRKVSVGNGSHIYAYERSKGKKKVLVILNLSGQAKNIVIEDNTLWGMAYNVFTKTPETLTPQSWSIEPWGYAVYEYGNTPIKVNSKPINKVKAKAKKKK